jgi:flagellar protein FlgJ
MSVSGIGPQAYTDLAGLAALKRGANAQDPAGIREAARQFETVFARMLLASMRAASPGDPLFDSNASGFYRDMFDDQLAMELTRGRGLGLAEMLVEQLIRGGVMPADETGQPAPKAGIEATSPPSARSRPDDGAPPEFVERFRPLAEAAARRLGVGAEAVIAHAALETGWGRHAPARADGGPSFNFFGIKATGGWRGPEVVARTVEFEGGEAQHRVERFRAYGSAQAAIDDYVRLVGGNPRYAAARGTGSDTASFARALQAGGYATDPNYARKLEAVAASVRQILDQGLKSGSHLPKQSQRSEA